jgi:hypothetical protein
MSLWLVVVDIGLHLLFGAAIVFFLRELWILHGDLAQLRSQVGVLSQDMNRCEDRLEYLEQDARRLAAMLKAREES